MILIGELSLWVAMWMAAWAATVSFVGAMLKRRDLTASGERAIYATLAMVVLASAGLWTALFTHDFSVRYVASFSSANLPKVYTVIAFWAGQAGSLLFWCLILASCSAIAVFTTRARNRAVMPYLSATMGVVLLVFIGASCLGANPFQRLDWIPPEGQGLNPRLQNPGMAVHRPGLYLGYACMAVSVAFAIAALFTRQLGAEVLAAIRKWARLGWIFSTTAIMLGIWWAYVEPEWGAHWALAPLQNGSLFPWLVNTALVHAITPKKGAMFRKWNAVLMATPAISGNQGYGRHIAHLGLVVVLAGLAGSAFGTKFDLTLEAGETKELRDPFGYTWRLASQGLSQYSVLNREVTVLALDISRDGKREGVLTAEKRQYVDSRGAHTFEPSTEAGIRGSWLRDVYVVLAGVREDQAADVRVTFNPLVRWVWVGGALMVLGGLMAMLPQAPPKDSADTAPGADS